MLAGPRDWPARAWVVAVGSSKVRGEAPRSQAWPRCSVADSARLGPALGCGALVTGLGTHLLEMGQGLTGTPEEGQVGRGKPFAKVASGGLSRGLAPPQPAL